MNRNKAKGTRVEREIRDQFRAAGWKADRVWGSGSARNAHEELADDLKVSLGGLRLSLEVKSRKGGQGWTTLERWMQEADGLVLKQNHRPPLIVLPLATLLRIAMPDGGGEIT